MASRSYDNVFGQLDQQLQIANDRTYLSYAYFSCYPASTAGCIAKALSKPSQHRIGGPQGKQIHCDWPQCLQTFTRQSDLTRHRNTLHRVTKHFWCMVHGCNRNESYPGQKRPFPRKDKRDAHVKRVHGVPKHDGNAYKVDLSYTADSPAYTEDYKAYTTGDRTLFNWCGINGATTLDTCQATGLTPFDAVVDAARCTGTACLNDPALFSNAGEPTGMTNLVPLNGISGLNRVNTSIHLPGSTSLYNPSSIFSGVDTANSTDSAYLVGYAASNSVSSPVGIPNSEASNWIPGSSEIAKLIDFNGFSSANGITNMGELTSIDGVNNVDWPTDFDESIAIDGINFSDCPTIGTLPTDDMFDWSTSGFIFNEFGGIDTSSGV